MDLMIASQGQGWHASEAGARPHVYFGYTHNERGDGKFSILDYKILASVRKAWDNKNK